MNAKDNMVRCICCDQRLPLSHMVDHLVWSLFICQPCYDTNK